MPSRIRTHPPSTSGKPRIVRTEGTLDPTSRELFAIARIDDPFHLESDLPGLRIGQPLRASISGITLEDVYVIPRTAMRGLNRIFLIEKDDPKILKTGHRPCLVEHGGHHRPQRSQTWRLASHLPPPLRPEWRPGGNRIRSPRHPGAESADETKPGDS